MVVSKLLLTVLYASLSFHVNAAMVSDIPSVHTEGSSLPSHVFRDRLPFVSTRNDLVKKERPSEDHIHEVVFVVKLRNMEKLTKILHDVSDPLSDNYGYHLTKDQVSDLTSNPEAKANIMAYLNSNGADVVSETLGGEYVTATAPVIVWEMIFNTEFYEFQQTHHNGDSHDLIRAEEYWIPTELDEHVLAVMNTIEMPVLTPRYSKMNFEAMSDTDHGDRKLTGGYTADEMITPRALRAYYNMGNSRGSSLSTQLVFGTNDGYFGSTDLASFLVTVADVPNQAAVSVGGHDTADCTTHDCVEGNLDMQYIMAMSPVSPTTFWWTRQKFSGFLLQLANTPKPPLVISISYGTLEKYVTEQEHVIFTQQAIRLSVMGCTMLIACGDNGASGTYTGPPSGCSYQPDFPSGNPYVVAVGATSVNTEYCNQHLFFFSSVGLR